MAYIGRDTDKISNVEVLDNITFNGSSSYTLQKGGVNFTPSSANTLLVSIDGVVQAGNFTVSGSTIDFGTAVAGTSTCDFILHYGVGLITTPADGTVTSAKINYPLTTFSSTGIDDNATSTAITIDSSENVGIGTSSPASTLEISKNDRDNGCTLSITNSHSSTSWEAGDIIGTINFRTDDTSTTEPIRGQIVVFDDASGASSGAPNNSAMKFSTALNNTLSERMRIDSSGRLLIGTSSAYASQCLVQAKSTGGAGFSVFNSYNDATSGTRFHFEFRDGSGATSQGNITTNGSSTSYNTTSDYRLKENVSYDFDATTRLKQLKPARFNFIADADKTVDGFLAHEVSSIVPEAISGEKDATETKEKVVVNANGQVIAQNIEQADWENGKIADEDGNTQYPTDSTWKATKVVPVYQGIDQAKLVPVLTKALQEAVDKIEQLETRITALENA